MDEAEFLTHLRSTCTNAIDEYRLRFPEDPPLSEYRSTDDSPLATEKDIQTYFEALTHYYDELLDVDSTPYHDRWRDHIVYDLTHRERLALLVSDLPESLTFFWIGGRYAAHTGHIGISLGELPRARACSVLASELCHAYQHRFNSPTWHHPYLQEGFDKAVSAQALEHVGSKLNDEAMSRSALRQRAQALLGGTLAHGTRYGGITAASLREFGVTTEELSELQAAIPWRVFGRIQPRYRWSSTAFLPAYDLFGSLLVVSDALDVPDTFARAFWDEHPWAELIADIRSIAPSKSWQWYHPSKES